VGGENGIVLVPGGLGAGAGNGGVSEKVMMRRSFKGSRARNETRTPPG
jgi:hypothetical protein